MPLLFTHRPCTDHAGTLGTGWATDHAATGMAPPWSSHVKWCSFLFLSRVNGRRQQLRSSPPLSPLRALALSLAPRCDRRGSPHPVRARAAASPGTAPWCAVQRRWPRPRPSPCSPPALPRPAGPRVLDETLAASSLPSVATKLGAWI